MEVLQALITLAVGLGGPVGAWVVIKRQTAASTAAAQQAGTTAERQLFSEDADRIINQLQENLASLRAEFDRHVLRTDRRQADDERQMQWQASVVRHLDDEVQELRAILADRGMQPPHRKPWPPRPVTVDREAP